MTAGSEAQGAASTPPRPNRRGRPRSLETEAAVLDATYHLLTVRGLKGTSIDAIALHSGVSKATIYKWWPNRAAVMMSAFLREATAAFPHPDFDSAESIAAALRQTKDQFLGPLGRMMTAVVGQCQSDADLATAFRTRYIAVRRQDMARRIRQAIADGQLQNADPDVLTDVLYAPIFHRLFIGHQPLTDAFIDDYLKLVLHGIAAPALTPATLPVTPAPPSPRSRTPRRAATPPRPRSNEPGTAGGNTSA